MRAQRSNLVRDLRFRGASHGLGCFPSLRFGAGSARERAPRNDGKGLLTAFGPRGGEWLTPNQHFSGVVVIPRIPSVPEVVENIAKGLLKDSKSLYDLSELLSMHVPTGVL